MNDLKLFESQYIRSSWNEEEGQWYFSVVDVVGALTESPNPQLLESTKKSIKKRRK